MVKKIPIEILRIPNVFLFFLVTCDIVGIFANLSGMILTIPNKFVLGMIPDIFAKIPMRIPREYFSKIFPINLLGIEFIILYEF